MGETMIGVIGGSGVYQIDALEGASWTTVESPFGPTSDQILTGTLGGVKMAFLPRHGRGHSWTPATVPYRANIDAMKRLGVTDIISVSACGSFREEMAPGDFVMVDQFVDRTSGRISTFFDEPGLVAHVSMAFPTCPRLRAACLQAASEIGVKHHDGGTYITINGPQFGSYAESILFRETFKCDVVGMTNSTEAKLAREAEICYQTVAMVTDYDSWHPDHGEVDITDIMATLKANVSHAAALVEKLPGILGADREPCPHKCDRSLDFAIMTDPAKRDPALIARLDAVAGRVL